MPILRNRQWQVLLTSVIIGGDGIGGVTGGVTLLWWAPALGKICAVMRDDVGVGGVVGIGDGVSDAEPRLQLYYRAHDLHECLIVHLRWSSVETNNILMVWVTVLIYGLKILSWGGQQLK